MPIEELYKNIKEPTRRIMMEVSKKKEEFIQNHIRIVERYYTEVMKGFRRNTTISTPPKLTEEVDISPNKWVSQKEVAKLHNSVSRSRNGTNEADIFDVPSIKSNRYRVKTPGIGLRAEQILGKRTMKKSTRDLNSPKNEKRVSFSPDLMSVKSQDLISIPMSPIKAPESGPLLKSNRGIELLSALPKLLLPSSKTVGECKNEDFKTIRREACQRASILKQELDQKCRPHFSHN